MAVIVLPRHARSTPEADDGSAAFFKVRPLVSVQTVNSACASEATSAASQLVMISRTRCLKWNATRG